MPYELIVNGGAVTAGFLILGFLVKNFTESNKATSTKYEELVERTMEEAKRREDILIAQLDKYNHSLKEISENIKVIPKMQEDIASLKKEREDNE